MADNVFNLQDFLAGGDRPRQPRLPIPQPVAQEYMPPLTPRLSPATDLLNALQRVIPAMQAPPMVPQRQPVAPVQIPYQPGKQPAPREPLNLSLEDITNLVRAGESSGNYTALNREQPGNTASGAYQYTDRTWNGYGGYAKAMLAPREVQDRRFAEDIARRHEKYGGDVFKIIAEHYLPAAANNPARWRQPYKLQSGKTVRPVETYVRHILRQAKNPELERAFDEYISKY